MCVNGIADHTEGSGFGRCSAKNWNVVKLGAVGEGENTDGSSAGCYPGLRWREIEGQWSVTEDQLDLLAVEWVV